MPSAGDPMMTDFSVGTQVNAQVSVQQYKSQFIKEGLRLKLAKQLGKAENHQVSFFLSCEL
jgi:hypothetical protein